MPDARHVDPRLGMWYCCLPGSCKLPYMIFQLTDDRDIDLKLKNHAFGLMALIAHTSNSDRSRVLSLESACLPSKRNRKSPGC